jgi:hypothetical protein
MLYVVASFLVSIQLATSQSLHTGYWRKNTPEGKSYKCQAANTRESMIEILREVGWPIEEGIPSVNWQTDKVTIIAPDTYNKKYNLAFFGLEWNGNASRFELNYGSVRIKSEEVGPNSASFGSVSESVPQTIVVSHPRNFSDSNFYCINEGYVD